MRAKRRIISIGAPALAAAALATVLVVSPWDDDSGRGAAIPSVRTYTNVVLGSAKIPQPPLGKLNKRTRRKLAPAGRRVDLSVPSFSHPTEITNPLFPVGELRSALLLGTLDGKPWRAETTLLPETKVMDWNGRRVETRESQFVAYLEGRIFEVAVDHYAQANDGSVWYLGEDAFTYTHGRISDTEGTWQAGVDGPPAMIMPAHPQVGDVYRTENIPGLVFEQVTVKKVGQTVSGPTGPVQGAMTGQELHMDEVRLEEKTFAPGYGEFFSGAGRTFEATALAVPADALPGPPPAGVRTLSSGADGVFEAARAGDWAVASTTIDTMRGAWDIVHGNVPKRLGAQMSHALDVLAGAVGGRDARHAPQAALDVVNACLDLELRYRPQAQIDLARFDLGARQLLVDAAANDPAAVRGDVATLEWIRDRIPLEPADARGIDDELRYLRAAAEAGEHTAVTAAAVRLRETVRGLRLQT